MKPHLDDFEHGLEAEERSALLRAFQFGISAEMAAKMHEPALARQFLPRREELNIQAAEEADPIGDGRHSPLPSLIHRYRHRVLWKIAPNCAVYCRFCFRKEHIGRRAQALPTQQRQRVLDYLAAHPEIEEVIFSGGDPLHLSAERLASFMQPLADIPHVQRLRIHSRVPVVAPSRIDAPLLRLLEDFPRPRLLVLHINHAAELSPAAEEALQRLRAAGVLLFSQSVLLRGVNDDVDSLAHLMNELLRCGVAPYYLHHLDWARGTAHFRVSLEEGLALESALRARLAGLAVPRYVVEIPGGGGKIPVTHLNAAQRAALNRGAVPELEDAALLP